jgi:hypothetical protein
MGLMSPSGAGHRAHGIFFDDVFIINRELFAIFGFTLCQF